MTQPDWKMLAAAEQAVIDRLDAKLFVNGLHEKTPQTADQLTAFRTAEIRKSIFDELAGAD